MREIKLKIVKCAKELDKLGLNIGSEGNVSYRLGKKIFITPSGISAQKLDEHKVSEVDLNGKIIDKKPSSEVQMHLSVYNDRPEVKCIVHCHSEWASILSCQREKVPAFHYMVAEFGGIDIRCSKYATFGSIELANNVTSAMKNRVGCLISNHGQLTVGDSLEVAMNLALALEKISKQYFFCKLSTKSKILSKSEMTRVLKLFRNYKIKH